MWKCLLSPSILPRSPAWERGQWHEREYKFFSLLEESVKKEGFRNPIGVTLKGNTFTTIYGLSRLWVAQKYNMPIPAIVFSFNETFEGNVELFTRQDVLDCFTDKPLVFNIKEDTVVLSGCEQVQLPEDRRVWFKEYMKKLNGVN